MCITGLMALQVISRTSNFTNILFHKEDYGSTAYWNFFCNLAWRKVLQQKEVVGDLASFVRVAKSKSKSKIQMLLENIKLTKNAKVKASQLIDPS